MPAPHVEADEIWNARYLDACVRFKQRDPFMSVHVFRATLKSLRFLPREIEAEVNLHWPGDKYAKTTR